MFNLIFRSRKDRELEAETKRCLDASDEIIAKAEAQLAKADKRSLSELLRDFAK
jgi:hypothetical protein